MRILVINAGSSSLKYQVLNMENESVLCKGVCEKIGQSGSFLNHQLGENKYKIPHAMPDHREALSFVLDTLCGELGVLSSLDEISAVGHRVLHGGEDFSQSVFVDDDVIRICKKNEPLGPLHMPANILCMEILRDLLGKPQVAVFDTSFHQTMPDYAYRYAVPKSDYTELKIRRYGFHGTSHKYVSGEARKLFGEANTGKIITCHLGNGASVAAIKDGMVVDTSMGFTPLEGLVMGTRSGDLDASVIDVIMKARGIDDISEFINKYLNKESGMKGICGKSDMREVSELAKGGNEDARLALDMFAYRVKKYIGAYSAVLNGVDCIIMTGGIGENSDEMRERILKDLEYLGVKLDVNANKGARGVVKKISTEDSKVQVWIIPTNEELVIARDTLALI